MAQWRSVAPMSRTMLRMERSVEPVGVTAREGVVARRWDGGTDRYRIPAVYAAAFGHDPWAADWDAVDEFDREPPWGVDCQAPAATCAFSVLTPPGGSPAGAVRLRRGGGCFDHGS